MGYVQGKPPPCRTVALGPKWEFLSALVEHCAPEPLDWKKFWQKHFPFQLLKAVALVASFLGVPQGLVSNHLRQQIIQATS